MSASLAVWMNGERVGSWSVVRGVHAFRYAESWLRSERVRSLSLSLPITPSLEIRGPVVESYFDNLLPDNDRIRERISRRFGTRGTDPYSLLEAIGRDCVGAVQLLPEGAMPEGWDSLAYEPVSEEKVAELLLEMPTVGANHDDDAFFRISLAGAQEKTALLKLGDGWGRPLGATPTTHILKLPLGIVGGTRQVDLANSVQNEWLCAQIVGELGLPVASTEMGQFGGQRVLVVERFDRQWMDDGRWIARLPQEDFCQALGYPPRHKYEADNGPGIARCLGLLGGSDDAPTDRLTFQLAQLSYWLLAATDGHAKNYSIFLEQGDRYGMTPLYDIISLWPYFGEGPHHARWHKAKLAMALRSKNAHYLLHTIQARHWHALAMRNGGVAVWEAMLGLIERAESALQAVEGRLPSDFPGATWEAIASGIRSQVQVFRKGLEEA